MSSASGTCPHCGCHSGRLDNHAPICKHVPRNLVERFMDESKNLSEWGREFGVSSNFISSQLRRLGMTKEAIHERIKQTAAERGRKPGKGLKRRLKKKKPDAQCANPDCGVVLWNDPADIPELWRSHAHWHINYGGYCYSCARAAGQKWERNRNLFTKKESRNGSSI